jgi:hypothetical protein
MYFQAIRIVILPTPPPTKNEKHGIYTHFLCTRRNTETVEQQFIALRKGVFYAYVLYRTIYNIVNMVLLVFIFALFFNSVSS